MTREDDEQRAIRRERHLRRLGSRDPRCDCGESEPAALIERDGEIQCYECRARLAGRATVEQHHIAGRHNDPTAVPLPGNVHRLASDEQRSWPTATLRNPAAGPLRRAAAWIRGWLDLLRVMYEQLAWLPPFLERLDEHLTDSRGTCWWHTLEFERGTDGDS